MNNLRSLVLGAAFALSACGPGTPPSPPLTLPALERPVVRVAPPAAGNANPEIPRAAFVERGGLPGIFVLDSNGQARFRLVRLGKTAGDRLEVISGLQPGEMLVRGDLTEVRDGSPVIPKTSANSPSPSRRGQG